MKPYIAIISLLAVVALGLTACSGSGGGKSDDGKDEILIGSVKGWDDAVAYSMLWEAVLEEQGYDVEINYLDIAINFTGLSDGQIDLYLGAVLPNTHGEYYNEYKDQIENYGAWNKEAINTIAVNENAPIDSLTELADNAEEFDNRIIGIEPGAGLTQVVEDEVIPTYDLGEMNFMTSSTAAMLTELRSKIDAGENVAVTLWQPHWVYNALPLKNLEDPEDAFGGAEEITALGRDGFAEDHPEVADWLEEFEMDMETFSSLIEVVSAAEDDAQREEAVQTWMEDNRGFVDGLTS